ncbi:MAG: PfkB family carbohydrate kinase [Planctomycetota bacterium]
MPTDRAAVGRSAAEKLRAADVGAVPAVLGLDGFVDEIIAVVDKRTADGYEPVPTIAQMSEKIAAASGKSANYELVVKLRKLGGNGPIMANAIASLGAATTYIGNLGTPDVDPVFTPLLDKADVISIGEPGHTDALEFGDGKLMLGKHESLGQVNWNNLVDRVGPDKLKALLSDAQLIGMVNWTMLPHMTDIWEHLLDEVVPNLEQHDRKLFIDLADPEKRTDHDIRMALRTLTQFQKQIDVILGLNQKEAVEVGGLLGVKSDDPETLAKGIRAELHLACVVVHPRHGAAAATADESAWFEGPFVKEPKISTGAGDHFNAGFSLGRVLGLSLEESLCTGVGTSGYYVRTAESPTATQLADFIENLPAPA